MLYSSEFRTSLATQRVRKEADNELASRLARARAEEQERLRALQQADESREVAATEARRKAAIRAETRRRTSLGLAIAAKLGPLALHQDIAIDLTVRTREYWPFDRQSTRVSGWKVYESPSSHYGIPGTYGVLLSTRGGLYQYDAIGPSPTGLWRAEKSEGAGDIVYIYTDMRGWDGIEPVRSEGYTSSVSETFQPVSPDGPGMSIKEGDIVDALAGFVVGRGLILQ